jgi:BirA family biotin operon repressor/biotin-[acetyl-CoA-carboxylase] ligase
MIIRLDEVDSTNSYLKQLARKQSLAEGTVVIAEFQTGGRGQQGNSWFSSRGDNLLFSLLLCPKNLLANEVFIISCITSLAIEKTLSQFIDNVRIKWPNDIYWNDKKIAGILIENNLQEGFVKSSVIGIGLNINEQRFSADLPNPVSLCQITKTEHDKTQILDIFLREFSALYQQFEQGKAAEIKEKYMRNLYRADGYHWFEDCNGKFSAKITDVLSSGHLVLKTKEKEERKYAFKEVRFAFKK